MRGRYLYNSGGTISGEELFDLREEGGLRRGRIESSGGAAGGTASVFIDAVLDGSWRVLSLEIRRKTDQEEALASYRWDGDCLAGALRRGGRRREIDIPMTGELELSFPSAAFDTIFFNRVALPPLSQRRIELVQISQESLEPLQTHVIVERLEDADIDWKGARMKAKRYAATDERGVREEIRALPLVEGSEAETALLRADRYRYVD